MRSKRVTTSCRIVLVEKYFHLKYSSASLKYTVVNATVIFPLIWIKTNKTKNDLWLQLCSGNKKNVNITSNLFFF